MSPWTPIPKDEELERADELLGQADALLRRHRGGQPTAMPAGLDDADLPILTDVVDEAELPALGLPTARPAAALAAADVPPTSARLANSSLTTADLTNADFTNAELGDVAPTTVTAGRLADLGSASVELTNTGSIDAPPAGTGASAPPPPHPATPPPPVPPGPPATALPTRDLSAADASIVSARAALADELIALDTELTHKVEAWLEAELPQIVARELDQFTERLHAEALARLRATLLPALSERIASRIDKLVD